MSPLHYISKETAARAMWKRLLENRRKAALAVLELLGNPDTTDADIAKVRRIATGFQEDYINTLNELRARFPKTDWRNL